MKKNQKKMLWRIPLVIMLFVALFYGIYYLNMGNIPITSVETFSKLESSMSEKVPIFIMSRLWDIPIITILFFLFLLFIFIEKDWLFKIIGNKHSKSVNDLSGTSDYEISNALSIFLVWICLIMSIICGLFLDFLSGLILYFILCLFAIILCLVFCRVIFPFFRFLGKIFSIIQKWLAG